MVVVQIPVAEQERKGTNFIGDLVFSFLSFYLFFFETYRVTNEDICPICVGTAPIKEFPKAALFLKGKKKKKILSFKFGFFFSPLFSGTTLTSLSGDSTVQFQWEGRRRDYNQYLFFFIFKKNQRKEVGSTTQREKEKRKQISYRLFSWFNNPISVGREEVKEFPSMLLFSKIRKEKRREVS